MQEIDQEKLTEFTHQLSEFQTEANKTASIDVYDRFTISKLEDHIVDLYQIAIDSAHEGLQYLCECMRDNIRDHFITGTNISEEEFTLMAEWKSLVKVYLVNNGNQKVVEAIATNLSKPGWMYPLKSENQAQVITALLANSVESNHQAQQNVSEPEVNAMSTDFDAYMKETTKSLADVFESDDDIDNGDDSIEEIPTFFEDDEPSMAECFEDLGVTESKTEQANSCDDDQPALQDELELKQSFNQQDDVQQVDVSKEELSQIQQPPGIANAHNLIEDEAIEEQDVSIEQEKAEDDFVKRQLNKTHDIEKVEVSSEELAEIKDPVSHVSEQETHIADSVQEENLSEDLSVTEAVNALSESNEQHSIEVSEQELSEIQEPSDNSLVDEIFVDESGNEVNLADEDLTKDLTEVDAVSVLAGEKEQDNIEVSAEELSEIDETVAPALENELHEEHDNENVHDEVPANAVINALIASKEQENIDVSAEELSNIADPVSLAGDDELYDQAPVIDTPEERAVSNNNLSSNDAFRALFSKKEQDSIDASEQEVANSDEPSMSVSESVSIEDKVPEEGAEQATNKLINEEVANNDVPVIETTEAIADIDEQNAVDDAHNDVGTPVMRALENELYVEDTSDKQTEYGEDFYNDLSENEAANFSPDSTDEHQIEADDTDEPEISESEISEPEISESEISKEMAQRSSQQEFYVDSDASVNDANYYFDNEHSSLPDSLNKDYSPDDARELTIAEEAIYGNNTNAVDNTSGFVDTSIEEVLPSIPDSVDASDTAEIQAFDAGDHQYGSEPVETIYIEPAAPKEEDSQPRSIIEAYVDAISSNKQRSQPDELEQELIEEPVAKEATVSIEPIETILAKYSDWTDEQKELLSLILSEASDVIEQQTSTLSVLHETPPSEEAILEMLSLYAEQIERIGSAAEMVGLDALQKLCELIGFHFGDLARASVEMIIKSEELIRQWPFIIYAYLKDIYNEDTQREAIEYISHDEWARTIREDIKSDLKIAFTQSTIQIEIDEQDQRLTTAGEEHVDVTVPDDVQAELLDGLLQELPHQTEELSSAIQALVNEEFLTQLEVSQRIAHTIKGAANTVGIVGVATLTHQLEDILQALLKAQAKPNKDLHAALVDAADCLEQMTEFLLEQGDRPADAIRTLQAILDWANYIDEYGPPEISDTPSTVDVKPSNEINKTEEVQEEKSKPSLEASLRVSANMIDELINQSGESIIANSQMHDSVSRLLHSLRDIRKNREDVYTLSQKLEHMIDVQGTQDKFSANIADDKFDPLELDQYNELHTYSRRLIEATADSVELVKDLEERLYGLETVIADQSRAQKDNQYSILKARMAPIESIVARLKRGVRQSAKISEKQVELEVLGADTLLDSKILNNLIDPLMHLLRNAVDHGVEVDDIRREQGKSLPAKITLSFEQVGERLEISCHDDGKGLDAEQIHARALAKGLITQDQDLSQQEIYQIIMQHGFSTRDEVTQLSGRGVGMDVVHSNIKDLNGVVQITSEKNKGMTVDMSLPVSLLTAHALLIPSQDGTIAVSTSGIEEILQVNTDDLIESEDSLMLNVEEQQYPAVHLEQLLKTSLATSSDQNSYSALLIENLTGGKKVVLVSEIQSVRDIIIKPFSHYLPKVDGLVGATVLGNGDVAVVVDAAELLAQQSELVGRLHKDVSNDLEVIHQASVLVVEDSISTRRSLAEFMQDLNYKVFTAKDGVEAVEIMRQHKPSILLTDLEMPRMNGLELTSYVRSHDETKDIPVIMLTSRTTEKHKQEAKSLGVNEYLTKPFVEDILLEKVQHLAEVK